MATFGKLNEFDTGKEDWNSYIEQLEFFFAANDINEDGKKTSHIAKFVWLKYIQTFSWTLSTTKAW